MSTIIQIPTWATFNTIPVGTPVDGLAALNAALGTALVVGDSNPVWLDLQDLDLGGGPLTRGNGLTDLAAVEPIQNVGFLTLNHVVLAVSVGGDVLGFPAWFEITDRSALTPVGLPNSTDELGAQVAWADWRDATTLPIRPQDGIGWGGKWYRSAIDASGAYLPASDWVGLVLSGAVTVVTRAQYLAAQV